MVDGFWGNIFRKAKNDENNVISMLKVVPILDGLSKDELKEFERIVHRRHYEPNENIFWEGEPGVGMYILQEGTVKIYKTLPDGNDKELASYIRGRLLDALIVGILSIITLYLLNIRYAFLIGALAGCANIIPHFGPIVGAIPAIVMALMETGSFVSVLVITIAFVAIQLLDYLLISHMVILKNVHMHPIIVFLNVPHIPRLIEF